MSEYQPTPKQEQAIREYLHEAVVPLIEDVLVKKLGQAMAFLKEQQNLEQEPVAWVGFDKDGDRSIAFEQKTLHEDDYPIASPLYIAPPKREWVGLTEDELEDLEFASVDREYGHLDVRVLSKAIEAKLKEKNNG